MTLHLTKLNEKAIMVKLTRRKANLTRRDSEAEGVVQTAMDDASLVVNKKLFRDKLNPINRIIAEYDKLYTYHKANTLPYVDVGPRLIPNTQYLEYAKLMKERIADLDAMMGRYMPDYDKFVQLDIAYRSQDPTKPSRAVVEDYPTAALFQASMGVDLKFMPLPDKSHFLFDVAEDDLVAFEQAAADAARVATQDTVARMLTPLAKMVDILNVPIGEKGYIFRDSTLENIIDGVEMAKKLCMDPSPELRETITQLEQTITAYGNVRHQLRESPIVRETARQKLAHIQSQMSAFMGAA